MIQQFGGEWTEKKLQCIQKYLEAYVKILSKTDFRFAYIDAFAGTGYREIKDEETGKITFPEMAEDDVESLLTGSVHRALQITTPFHKYIFVEQNPKKCTEMEEIKKLTMKSKIQYQLLTRMPMIIFPISVDTTGQNIEPFCFLIHLGCRLNGIP